jgi:hypothetical protein
LHCGSYNKKPERGAEAVVFKWLAAPLTEMVDHEMILKNRLRNDESGAHPRTMISWEERYDELLEYFKFHGHVKVPPRYKINSALAMWISFQGEDYRLLKEGKPNFLTAERIQMLRKVNFAWSVR